MERELRLGRMELGLASKLLTRKKGHEVRVQCATMKDGRRVRYGHTSCAKSRKLLPAGAGLRSLCNKDACKTKSSNVLYSASTPRLEAVYGIVRIEICMVLPKLDADNAILERPIRPSELSLNDKISRSESC